MSWSHLSDSLSWSRGHAGKGYLLHNGTIKTWSVDPYLPEDHSVVHQRNGDLSPIALKFDIDPDGGVVTESGSPKVEQIVQADPNLYDAGQRAVFEDDFNLDHFTPKTKPEGKPDYNFIMSSAAHPCRRCGHEFLDPWGLCPACGLSDHPDEGYGAADAAQDAYEGGWLRVPEGDEWKDDPYGFFGPKHEGRAAGFDPTLCSTCGGAMSSPRQLGNKWVNSCTRCGITRDVPVGSPLLQQERANWPAYPDLLTEVGKPRPWLSSWHFADGPYGYTNGDTSEVALIMDNDSDLSEAARKLVEQGATIERFRDWAIRKIVSPHNRAQIKDAQEWNDIPLEERQRMKRDSDIAQFGEAAVNMGESLMQPFNDWENEGKDEEEIRREQEYEAPDLIDPELVNWDELYQGIQSELEENDNHDRQMQDMANRGLGWATNHDLPTNQMRDAFMRSLGALPEEELGADYATRSKHPRNQYNMLHNIPFETLQQIPGWERDYTDAARKELWNHRWPRAEDKARQSLLGRGVSPEKVEEVLNSTGPFGADYVREHFPGGKYDTPLDFTDPEEAAIFWNSPAVQETQQNGKNVRPGELAWDVLNAVRSGRPHPYIPQMQTALQQRGYSPQEVEQIMQQQYRYDPETHQTIPLTPPVEQWEQQAEQQKQLDQPGDTFIPPDFYTSSTNWEWDNLPGTEVFQTAPQGNPDPRNDTQAIYQAIGEAAQLGDHERAQWLYQFLPEEMRPQGLHEAAYKPVGYPGDSVELVQGNQGMDYAVKAQGYPTLPLGTPMFDDWVGLDGSAGQPILRGRERNPKRWLDCPDCMGSGVADIRDGSPEPELCRTCDGIGQYEAPRPGAGDWGTDNYGRPNDPPMITGPHPSVPGASTPGWLHQYTQTPGVQRHQGGWEPWHDTDEPACPHCGYESAPYTDANYFRQPGRYQCKGCGNLFRPEDAQAQRQIDSLNDLYYNSKVSDWQAEQYGIPEWNNRRYNNNCPACGTKMTPPRGLDGRQLFRTGIPDEAAYEHNEYGTPVWQTGVGDHNLLECPNCEWPNRNIRRPGEGEPPEVEGMPLTDEFKQAITPGFGQMRQGALDDAPRILSPAVELQEWLADLSGAMPEAPSIHHESPEDLQHIPAPSQPNDLPFFPPGHVPDQYMPKSAMSDIPEPAWKDFFDDDGNMRQPPVDPDAFERGTPIVVHDPILRTGDDPDYPGQMVPVLDEQGNTRPGPEHGMKGYYLHPAPGFAGSHVVQLDDSPANWFMTNQLRARDPEDEPVWDEFWHGASTKTADSPINPADATADPLGKNKPMEPSRKGDPDYLEASICPHCQREHRPDEPCPDSAVSQFKAEERAWYNRDPNALHGGPRGLVDGDNGKLGRAALEPEAPDPSLVEMREAITELTSKVSKIEPLEQHAEKKPRKLIINRDEHGRMTSIEEV